MSSLTTLDDLPGELRLKIISYLPIQEAIQASRISPKWRNLWSSLPALSFDFPLSPRSTTVDFFFHFINRTLILRSHSTLSTLCLTFPFTPETHLHKFDIDCYVKYAVTHDLTSLSLTFFSEFIHWSNHSGLENIVYHFPFFTLKDSLISSLSLTRCNLTLGMNLSTINHFTLLNHVSLTLVYLTDGMLFDLVKLCENLEVLHLRRCNGMKHVRVCSLKLKTLRLWYYKCDEGSVEISAPGLCSLSIVFFEVGRYLLENAMSLVEARISFPQKVENYSCWSKLLRMVSHVKYLSCQNWGYKVAVDKDLFPQSFSFYNLSLLKMDTDCSPCDLLGMAALLEHAPNLETMVLSASMKSYEEILIEIPAEFSNIKFSLPSLRVLKVDCYWGQEADLCFLKLILRDQVVLERIILLPVDMAGIEAPQIVMVKQRDGFHVVEGSFPNLEALKR